MTALLAFPVALGITVTISAAAIVWLIGSFVVVHRMTKKGTK